MDIDTPSLIEETQPAILSDPQSINDVINQSIDHVPELHDALKSSFAGADLSVLESLGVSAYDSKEVESTIIAAALQAEAERESINQSVKTVKPAINSLKRKRIPRKSVDSEAPKGSSIELPSFNHRAVVEDDPVTASGTMAKKRLEKALDMQSNKSSDKSDKSQSAQSKLSAARLMSNHRLPLEEDASKESVNDAVRRRLVTTGEVTPFHSVQGMERGFRRVARQPLPTPPPARQPTTRPSRQPIKAVRPKPAANASKSSNLKPAAQPATRVKSVSPDARRPKPVKPVKLASRPRNPSPPPRPASVPIDELPRLEHVPDVAHQTRAESPAPIVTTAPTEPVRLTRAQIRAQVASIEAAVKRENIAQGIEEPEENKEPEVESKHEIVNDDDEWLGDSESSESDPEFSSRRRKSGAGRSRKLSTKRLSNGLSSDSKRRADIDESVSESEMIDDEVDHDDDEVDLDEDVEDEPRGNRSNKSTKRRPAVVDDFFDLDYEERLATCRSSPMFASEVARIEGRSGDSLEQQNLNQSADDASSMDIEFDGGLVVPGRIWDRLFIYQRTALQWMWELHCQSVGGIIADEMGLGKTIQVVSFLASLHYTSALQQSRDQSANQSASSSRGRSPFHLPPHLILVPATILTQWMREFHTWYPELRVLVLHDSVQAHHHQSKETVIEKLFQYQSVQSSDNHPSRCHILITTYESARLYSDLLLSYEWGYLILDEGHKIRNPDAKITQICKRFRSFHRLILTGSPIQNQLIELWSLFDYVYPGRLGTLPVFEEEFVIPINTGGFSNASPVAINLAYRCASILRDLINPYILRRTKAEVASHLPKKVEQVLFINLTPEQRDIYQKYIDSDDVQAVLQSKGSLFKAIHVLRKICNHPDLVGLTGWGDKVSDKPPPQSNNQSVNQSRKARFAALDPRTLPDYGSPSRSGKLTVLTQILSVWKRSNDRCLVFAQTRQMLDIIERLIDGIGYSYRRIDGLTSINQRLPMIDDFNKDRSIFCFLLTTKAGGLGVNLTGANRVLLFDPDWNPATDQQARERAWRIGQRQEVTVYRLIVRGTIEEKIYQRQIFKQFLTNKVLIDPKQKRFFDRRALKDLFTLDAGSINQSETARVFREVTEEIRADVDDAKERSINQSNNQSIKSETDTNNQSNNQSINQSIRTPDREEREEGEVNDDDDHIVQSARKRLRNVKVDDESDQLTNQSTSQSTSQPFSQLDNQSADDLMQQFNPVTIPDAMPDNQSGNQSNNRILSLLLSSGGVASAMNHDSIMEGANRTDRLIADNIAKRIAEKAVEALRSSREMMRNQSIDEPTWTGRTGVMPGANQPKKRFGAVSKAPINNNVSDVQSKMFDHTVSGVGKPGAKPVGSAALLAKLQSHNERGLVLSGSGLPSAADMSIEEKEANDVSSAPAMTSLLSDLTDFLRSSRRSTQTIIAHFTPRLINEQDKLVFRQLLRQVATLDKHTSTWKLKSSIE